MPGVILCYILLRTLKPEGKEIENTVVSRAHFNEPLLYMSERSFEKSLVADGQINRGLNVGGSEKDFLGVL